MAWSDNSGGETSYVLERSTDGGSTWSPLTEFCETHALLPFVRASTP
jgi:hypothetical protein